MSSVDPVAARNLKRTVVFGTKAYFKNGVDKCFLRQGMNQWVAANLVTAMMLDIVDQLANDDNADIQLDEWNQELIAIMVNGISL